MKLQKKVLGNPALLLPVLLACGTLLFLWAWLVGNEMVTRLTIAYGQVGYVDQYMDFFNCLFHSSILRVYEISGSIYPPFANLIYFVLSKLVVLGEHPLAVRASADSMALFVLYNVVLLPVLAVVMAKLVGGGRLRQFLAGVFCLTTGPMVYEVERGNILILCIIFCAVFLLWYRSENRVLRELALLCLALSANLKFYPALLGLLLLLDRKSYAPPSKSCKFKFVERLQALIPRWGDAARCAVYAAALFLIPFLFMGGLAGLEAMIESITSTSAAFYENGLAYKVDFRNTFRMLDFLYGSVMGIPSRLIDLSGYALMLGCMLAVPFCNSHWKQVGALCACIVGVPAFSYQYGLCYMLPVAALFFKEEFTRFSQPPAQTAPHKKAVRQTVLAKILTAWYALLLGGMLIALPFQGVGRINDIPLRAVSASLFLSAAFACCCLPSPLFWRWTSACCGTVLSISVSFC